MRGPTAAFGASALVACGAVAGCGGTHERGAAQRHVASCSMRISGAIARAASVREAPPRLVARQPQLLTCDFPAGAVRVRVVTDDLPQAYRRWDRAQVEQWQNTAGWAQHPARRPRPVADVGAGAFWIPGDRMLVATDGRRLVTVKVLRPAAAAPRALARAAAAAALGPPRPPVATGP